MSTKSRLSMIPRRVEHVAHPTSGTPAPTTTPTTNTLASKIPRRSERPPQLTSMPTLASTMAAKASPSNLPSLTKRAMHISRRSPSILNVASQAKQSKIPRRPEHAIQTTHPESASKMPTNGHPFAPQSSAHAPSLVQVRSSSDLSATTQQPTTSNINSNVNNVSGSVQTLINNNSITIVYGPVPNDSDEIQVKICAALKMRYVPQALYDAQLNSGCMEGTRVEILRDIIDWIQNTEAQRIFWLTGWAGTGKSAIAWTICRCANDNGNFVLGGSFFCSRTASSMAQRDVRCVIPTLALILARQSNTFSLALASELTRDPDILHKQVSVQIETLLSRPLLALASSPVPILFVIDALDECGGLSADDGALDDGGTHRIVSELIDAIVGFSSADVKLPVKFLVTSRPETHIRETPVSDIEVSKVLRLQTVDKEQVAADIHRYITAELLRTHRLRERFTELDVDSLVKHCDGLFIVATTALQYALRAGIDIAVLRFRKLLGTSKSGLNTTLLTPLDRMYDLILEDAATMDETASDGMAMTLQLLAALLSARMTLSVAALADLLDLPTDNVRAVLSCLHAVVHVPDDELEPDLRTLHASFGDYVFRRAPVHIRISSLNSHDGPARASLRIMAERLHFNVSQSRSSYERNQSERPDGITLSLEYACTQWIYHIASLSEPSVLDKLVGEIFCRQFMFWLEVMSMLGQVQRAAAMLYLAAVTVRSPELSEFFRDANAFVASSREAIEQSAPHIYLSALPFADKEAMIYKTFAPLYSGLACVDVSGIDPRGGRLLMTFKGHNDVVTSVAYSPDGLLIASASKDGTLRIWDTRTADESMPPLRGNDGEVHCVAFAPNGRSVAGGTKTGVICIWNVMVSQSNQPRRLVGHESEVTCLAFSEDTSRLVSAAGVRQVKILVWSVITGQMLAMHSNVHASHRCYSIAFSSKGEVLMSLDVIWHFMGIEYWGRHGYRPMPQFSPSGSIAMRWHNDILLWARPDLSDSSFIRLKGHASHISSAVFSPDGRYIASASDDASVRIWNAQGRSLLHQSVSPLSLSSKLETMSLVGAIIITILPDISVHLWDPMTGGLKLPTLTALNPEVSCLAISSDQRFIACGHPNGTVQLWSAHTGEPRGKPLKGHQSTVRYLSFTPDMRWLASGSDDSTVLLWDVETGQASTFRPLDMETGIWALVFSTDSTIIAIAKKQIHFWQVRPTQRVLKSLQESDDRAHSIFFSPDSKHIASGAYDNLGRVWNVNTGQLVFQLIGHTGSVSRVTYSPDGQYIATGSTDESVRLWNAKNGQPLVALFEHLGPVTSLGFAFDGMSLVSCYKETIRVLDVTADCLDESRILSAATLKNGWLTGPSGELLLWVPVEYHPYLHILPWRHVNGDRRVSISIGRDGWHSGEAWIMCPVGGGWNVDLNTI